MKSERNISYPVPFYFDELDEYQLTNGRLESHRSNADGWHFGGTQKQMEIIVLFNVICKSWLVLHQTNGGL